MDLYRSIKRVGLALELYNAHLFEVSTRARFLHLVSIVETLSKPGRQQASLIEHLNELVKQAKEHLNALDSVSQDDRDNFIQRLNELKCESISSACRTLVRKYLGDPAAKVFKECYNVRSKLVHEGTVSPEIDC